MGWFKDFFFGKDPADVRNPEFNRQQFQRDEQERNLKARRHGQIGLNSALGGYSWVENPDGSRTLQTNLAEDDKQKLEMVKKGLGGIDMNAPSTSMYDKIRNMDMSSSAGEKAFYDKATNYLKDDFKKQTNDMYGDLEARGIPIGSRAHNRSMENLQDQQNQALQQASSDAVLKGVDWNRGNLQNEISKANSIYGAETDSQQRQLGKVLGLGGSIRDPMRNFQQGQRGDYANPYELEYQQAMNQANADREVAAKDDGVLGRASRALGALNPANWLK